MPVSPHALLATGLKHHQAGALAEAELHYRQIPAAAPEHADALHLLGVLAHQAGRSQQAVALIRAAIRKNARFSSYHNNLGNALNATGNFAAAEISYFEALRLDPSNADAHANLGSLFESQGRLDEAHGSFSQALWSQPTMLRAHIALSTLAAAGGDPALALHHAGTAIRLASWSAAAHNVHGNALLALGRSPDAQESYRRALSLDPAFADAHYNLGNLLRKAGDSAAAIAAYRRSIVLAPDRADVFNNLALVLSDTGQIAEALTCFDRALALNPVYAEARWHRGMTLLLAGDYIRGWSDYEWRWRARNFTSPDRRFFQPQWRGAPLDGATILLHAEQGLGDTLQFARYAPLVAARGGRVLLEVQPALHRLLAATPGIAQCIAQGDPLLAFDLHCPLLSLPGVFATTLENVPPATLLSPEPLPLPDFATHLKVGLTWAGNPKHKADRHRSIPLALFRPLAALTAIAFIPIQKGLAAAEALTEATIPGHLPFHAPALCASAVDFADTAALISALDLIITVDTAVAHLAGSLGIPVWILLPAGSEWRWGLSSATSPWYPSARLFRASPTGGWPALITELAAALFSLVSNRGVRPHWTVKENS